MKQSLCPPAMHLPNVIPSVKQSHNYLITFLNPATLSRIFALLLLCNLFASCKKEEQVQVRELDEVADAKLIQSISQSGDDGIPFPDGSMAISLPDGRIKIVLPTGYKFLMIDPETSLVIEDDGEGGEEEAGVTCSCTSGSGCSPVKFKRKYYCVLGETCTTCTKSTTRMSGARVLIAGIYKPDDGITVLSKIKQDGLKGELTSVKKDLVGNATTALFQLKGVQQELRELYTFIYGKQIPGFILNNTDKIPAGYKYVAINIYGNEAAIPVPTSQIGDTEYIVDDGEGGGATCKCNDATPTGCKKDSFFGAVFCDAKDCRSCSLND